MLKVVVEVVLRQTGNTYERKNTARLLQRLECTNGRTNIVGNFVSGQKLAGRLKRMRLVGGRGCQILKQDDFIKSQLVSMGWRFGQSYSGGHIAAEMVMHAIANRVRIGWGSWLQVIEAIPQYMAENELPRLTFPSIWEPNFVKVLHAVDGVFDGSTPDKSKGALYWANLALIERPWFLEKIVRSVDTDEASPKFGLPRHPRVADMNNLSFWK